MRSLVLLASVFAFSGLVQSAANSYGDEQVTPAPGSAPAQAAPEQSAVESVQDAPEGAGSQSSGYDAASSPQYPLASAFRHRLRHRVMRHRVLRHRVFHRRRFARNAYGDEQVTPGPSHGVAAPSPSEQGPSYQPAPPAPVQVHPLDAGCGAPPPPPPPPPVSSPGYNAAVSAPAPHSGGYAQGPSYHRRIFKHRRVARGANTYGDEQVTPAPGAAASEPTPAETPAEETHQDVVEGAGSQSSGYDSGVAASTSSIYQSVPTFRNRFRHRVMRQRRVFRHRVMKLRHRVKRGANSYGDEQVTPAPGTAPAQPAPEQNAVETLQDAPEGAGSQSSGYDAAGADSSSTYPARNRFRHRVMRQRRVLRHRVFHRRRFARGTYGDEAITPAPEAPVPAPEASEPVESAPDQAQQSSPGGAAIQPSGYRA